MKLKEILGQLDTLKLNQIDVDAVKHGNTITESPKTLVAIYDERDVSEEDAKWFLKEIADKSFLDFDRMQKLNPYIVIVNKIQWENVFRSTRNFIKDIRAISDSDEVNNE